MPALTANERLSLRYEDDPRAIGELDMVPAKVARDVTAAVMGDPNHEIRQAAGRPAGRPGQRPVVTSPALDVPLSGAGFLRSEE